MYNIINNIISHSWATSDSAQQYIYMICGVVIAVVLASLIDMVYRVFRHFWRR